MVTAPNVITPNAPDIHGKVVTIFVTYEAPSSNICTINLPTDAPKIDLTLQNPVLQVICNDEVTPISDIFDLDGMCQRADEPDGAGEWSITDLDTISAYVTADQVGQAMVTYIAAGVQLQ